jgi:NADH-quinone oxidoreductase subunit M
MEDLNILSIIIFLPIISALAMSAIKTKNDKNFLHLGLIVCFVNFIISAKLFFSFDKSVADFQYKEVFQILNNLSFKYYLGIDGISIIMILLTTFLTPICLLISYNTIKTRVKEFVICFLLIQGFVIGSFCAIDLLLFYIFFEATLIPMFLVIGIWGGKDRIYSSYKFFLYTLFGSVIFLIAIIYIYVNIGSTDITILKRILPHINLDVQKLLWLAFFISFAIKIPMFPVHTWLPDAHVQAPTAGSVILAGILIKLGAYAMIRFLIPFFPDASIYFTDFVFTLSIIAIIYASLVALMQKDMKKMIAYSSVAHMGYVTMGIFSFNQQGIDGAITQMISHGLVSAALFICVGVIYDRIQTKEIAQMGGITNKMPNFALLFMIFTMASVGLPGTSGFVGEFLSIVGTFKASKITAILATSGIILGAAYMLWLYKRVAFGAITNPKIENLKDVNIIEVLCLGSLAFFTILLGLLPNLILSYYKLPVSQLVNIFR